MKNIIDELYDEVLSYRVENPDESEELHKRITDMIGREQALKIDDLIGQLVALATREGFNVGLKAGVELQKALSVM